MQKHYPFWEFEPEVRTYWEGKFTAEPNSSKKPYTIVMPPPNVTGYLHLGHAFSSTLQDILIRFKRMQGYDALWLPGTDHAGIATQMMVEKQLATEGLTRQQLGREAFLKHVWSWKEKYGGLIIDQMKGMGFSADWSHLCFTLDPAVTVSVLTAFVDLYKKGLVYRAYRLINWDPVLQTAVSDLEVVSKERTDPMFTLRYPIKGGGHIDVATTRPETIFGDVAIAVHPKDARYTAFIGKKALIPLINREIPIIADEAVLQEKGTGAVKITPAHDFLDFEIGQRHGLASINVFDDAICLNTEVPAAFQGLDRDTARREVVQALGEACIAQNTITHSVPHSDRSQAILEPRLKYQWFVDMKDMARKGLEVVASGKIAFVPQEWAANYARWLENIQPWCVSRQLWWGHQIPAWYTEDGQVFVAINEEEAYKQARSVCGDAVVLVRDEDVLDTWFSSGLWPFSTLGWPEKTTDMQRYYPGDVLITGFDILFFWVARMIMLGVELTDSIPFKTVYLHPLIRDERGQKMSKTKGNVVNPLDVSKEYGVDALRFALSWIAAPVQHVSFGIKHVEHSRNFITKMWNMSRFVQMNNLCQKASVLQPSTWIFNAWILGKTEAMVEEVTKALEEMRFHEAAFVVYEYAWKTFCDWYLELVKDALRHDETLRADIQATTTYVLSVLLRVLHPFIPFVTEKLWSLFGFDGLLCTASWPTSMGKEETEADWLIALMGEVRRLRQALNLGSAPLTAAVKDASKAHQCLLERHQGQLARVLGLAFGETDSTVPSAHLLIDEAQIIIPIAHLVDIETERQRLQKAVDAAAKEADVLQERLSKQDFLDKAPRDIIEGLQKRLQDAVLSKEAHQQSLDMLKG